jgi:DNA recombination protein RmuC
VTTVGELNELTQSNETSIENIRKSTDGRIQSLQTSNENSLKQIRQTVTEHLQTTSDTLVNTVGELGKAQTDQLTNSTKAINDLTQSNKTSIDDVRTMVDKRLQDMQTSNESKLDEMRKTVDEQLHSTLEKRLGESFNIVSQRLEEVQRGLGEMQSLATGVGDLKRVLTNVKARGTWGEVQLGTLLEDILTPDQYSTNVKLHENSHEEVEYAIRLPGNDGQDSCVWLPIDSKLPLADYERLVNATDATAENRAAQALTRVVRAEAKKIQEKYIAPPKTTGFAIMFLPTEGLYAEVLRVPGLITELLQSYRIVVAGPTTLAAILNSLRMGFRTLAIEKHSSEVWEVLGAVKSEFGKFGGVMAKLKRQLNTAVKTVDATDVRTRAMERRLRTVEELPAEEASVQIGLPDGKPAIQQNGGDD